VRGLGTARRQHARGVCRAERERRGQHRGGGRRDHGRTRRRRDWLGEHRRARARMRDRIGGLGRGRRRARRANERHGHRIARVHEDGRAVAAVRDAHGAFAHRHRRAARVDRDGEHRAHHLDVGARRRDAQVLPSALVRVERELGRAAIEHEAHVVAGRRAHLERASVAQRRAHVADLEAPFFSARELDARAIAQGALARLERAADREARAIEALGIHRPAHEEADERRRRERERTDTDAARPPPRRGRNRRGDGRELLARRGPTAGPRDHATLEARATQIVHAGRVLSELLRDPLVMGRLVTGLLGLASAAAHRAPPSSDAPRSDPAAPSRARNASSRLRAAPRRAWRVEMPVSVMSAISWSVCPSTWCSTKTTR
jgi:hypothetical protein